MCPKCGYSAKEYKPSYQPKVVVKKPPFGILFFFALIEIIICLPAGIIAVVFATIMKQRFEAGAFDESDQYKKYAIRTLLIGFLIFLIIVAIFAYWLYLFWQTFGESIISFNQSMDKFNSSLNQIYDSYKQSAEINDMFTNPFE
jgi:uncharacterized membrane protein